MTDDSKKIRILAVDDHRVLRHERAIPMISIVDDDESVREAVKSLLKSGYRTKVFASAEEFLRTFLRRRDA